MTTAIKSIGEPSAPSWTDRLAPSIPALVFVCLAFFVPLVAQPRLLNGDGDLARHLRHGLYMLQHHSLIWHDPFSFTRAGQPFVPFEYGSQLIYALVYEATGLAGVTIFAGLLIATTYAIIARILLRHRVDALLVLITICAAVLLGYHHWLARPHLISWVAITVLFGMLESEKRPPIWVYPLFFALWANLHGGWLYGLALMLLFNVGNFIDYLAFDSSSDRREAARYLAQALLLATIATLATPMGFRLWSHVYAHLGDSYVMDRTSEFASPDFHSLSSKILLAIVLGALASLILSRRRMRASLFLVVFAGVWWAFVAARNLPLFGVTGLTAVALHVDAEWRRLPGRTFSRWRLGIANGNTHANTAGWIVCCMGLLVLAALGHGKVFGMKFLADEFDSSKFPVEAVRKARAAHLGGRFFADFTWGGYILYAWPEQKVFVDGGTDFYGSAIVRDYLEISSLQPTWKQLLAEHEIDGVITRPQSLLARALVRADGWSLWYCDTSAAIMRRQLNAATRNPHGEQALAQCANDK